MLLLSACPASPAEGEEGVETGESESGGEQGACTDPGSELLAEVRPSPRPSQNGNPVIICSSGWGSDAPTRDPSWTLTLPNDPSQEFYQSPMLLAAHPEEGVIGYSPGFLAHYDASGEEVWSNDSLPVEASIVIEPESAGTFLVATYDYNADDSTLMRYAADGSEIGEINVMWNEPSYAQIWAMQSYGEDILLGTYDADSQGNFEETLLHLDSQGGELLRRSTSLFGGLGLAVNDAGSVLFGSSPGFVVSLEDGGVLGQLQPSAGFGNTFVGMGADFYGAINVAGDFGFGAYSSLGDERWLQQYDRAGQQDSPRALDAANGVVVAAGSTSVLNFSAVSFWFSSQPMVMAADSEGNALWIDRIDAYGDANDVAIGADGAIYVSGLAEEDGPVAENAGLIRWLRKYEG